MKNRTIVLLLSTLFFLAFAAPVYADKPRAKGYFITGDGTKQNCMVSVPLKLLSKTEVWLIQQPYFTVFDKKGKETRITDEIASEIGFTFNGETYVFKVLPKVLQGATHIRSDFYYVLLEGPCSLYVSYVSQNGNSTEYCLYKSETEYYITMMNTVSLLGKSEGRVLTIEKFFSDCPDLLEKLKTKEYKRGDDRWLRIVQYYNKSCKQNQESVETQESAEKEE